MCTDLLKAIFLLHLVFGYYRIAKSEGGQFLGLWKGFCWNQQILWSAKNESQKNQFQLYHSIEDEKLSKNHLKTITWKFHAFELCAFESCIKLGPAIYRPDTESVISQKLLVEIFYKNW